MQFCAANKFTATLAMSYHSLQDDSTIMYVAKIKCRLCMIVIIKFWIKVH